MANKYIEIVDGKKPDHDESKSENVITEEHVIAVIDDKPIVVTSMEPLNAGCVKTEEGNCDGIQYTLVSKTFCETHWVPIDHEATLVGKYNLNHLTIYEFSDWGLSPVETALGLEQYWEGTDYNYSVTF